MWTMGFFVESKKEGMLKIPEDIAATPLVVVCSGVKPAENHGTNPDMTPFDVDIEVARQFHSSVSSGRRKHPSTLFTNLRDW
jgi:hypothetical protein